MSTWRDQLTPLKRSPRPSLIVAFDTEGTGEADGFLCGAVSGPSGDCTFSDRSEMLRYLTAPCHRNHTLWAHNLEYDLSVLTGGDLTWMTALFAYSRLLWAETQDDHDHHWKFCDSGNLFPGLTVAALGEHVGCPKAPMPDKLHLFALGVLPRSDITPSDLTTIRDYCLRDAVIVRLAVEQIQDELMHLGGQLAPTIAGCAMDLYRRRYQAHAWTTPPMGVNNVARSSYYGGRVEPFRLGRVHRVACFDVNSLYSHAQREASLPDPAHLTMDIAPRSRFAALRYPGWSSVTVSIQDQPVPPLPVRLPQGLYFPHGRVKSVWTHNELCHALENGVALEDVHWSWYSTQGVRPFVDYVDDLYALKAASGEARTTRRLVYKLLLNSLYGRWGVANDGGLARLIPATSTQQLVDLPDADLRMIQNRPYLLVPMPTDQQPRYAITPWAAVIAAEARIRMWPRLAESSEQLCYTDTDSLWTTGSQPTSSDIGELRKEQDDVDLWIVAPKAYAVFRDDVLLAAHAKGIPEAYRLAFLSGGGVHFHSPVGIREAARTDETPGTWIERLRQLRYNLPKRAPELTLSETVLTTPTRPWSTAELQELLQPGPQDPSQVPTVLDP